MPSRFQKLMEFFGFAPDSSSSDDFDIDSSSDIIYEAAEVELTPEEQQALAEYDFPDLNVSDYVNFSQFSKFTELANDRATQYAAYDNMTSDIIISSALEMYADDASQYDNQGRLIWAESDNPELVEYIDKLLDTLSIGKSLWVIYYNLALYGDVYIRLFKQTNDIYDNDIYPYKNLYDQLKMDENILDISSKYLPYIEVSDEPENIYELVKNGKTVQYAYVNKNSKDTGQMGTNAVELYPPDQFIHIYIENPHIRDRETFSFKARDDANGITKTYTYKVRRGKSMLHDIYAVEREIQLLENALLLNRISKSAITRLVQMEVGDMPKPQVRNLTRRLKTSLEAKLSINTDDKAMKNYLASSGIDNLIVSPTRNGKGGISIETISADPDTRSILDLDYFNDKRFGGLRIPKAFLGYDETLSANSGGTLAQLDARYGRSVKRLQTCVIAGITDMVNLFLLHDNRLNDIGEFKIRVVSPTTADDLARDENLSNKLRTISDILNVIEDDPKIDRTELFQHLITSFIGDSRISDEIYRQRIEHEGEESDNDSEPEDTNPEADAEFDRLMGNI